MEGAAEQEDGRTRSPDGRIGGGEGPLSALPPAGVLNHNRLRVCTDHLQQGTLSTPKLKILRGDGAPNLAA